MEWDNEAVIKHYEQQLKYCHEGGEVPTRPVTSKVEHSDSQIPVLLPHSEDKNISEMLKAWYYAGYYTGRFQAFQEMQSKKG